VRWISSLEDFMPDGSMPPGNPSLRVAALSVLLALASTVAAAADPVGAEVVAAADEVPAAATVGRATKMVVPHVTNCKRKSRDESCGFFLDSPNCFRNSRPGGA